MEASASQESFVSTSSFDKRFREFRFGYNAKCVAMHQSRENPTIPAENAVTQAYGAWDVPQLLLQCKNSSEQVVMEALHALKQRFRAEDTAAVGALEDASLVLLSLLHHDNTTVQAASLSVLHMIASRRAINKQLLTEHVIHSLALSAESPDVVVRLNAVACLVGLCSSAHGARLTFECELVTLCVRRVLQEHPRVQLMLLAWLRAMLDEPAAVIDALQIEAVSVMTQVLQHDDARVRELASACVMKLSVPDVGKMAAITGTLIPELITLLSDPAPPVRSNAAGALMYISVYDDAKPVCSDAGIFAPLAGILNLGSDDTLTTQAYATRIICNLCTAPACRNVVKSETTLRTQLDDLLVGGNLQDQDLLDGVRAALAAIDWKP